MSKWFFVTSDDAPTLMVCLRFDSIQNALLKPDGFELYIDDETILVGSEDAKRHLNSVLEEQSQLHLKTGGKIKSISIKR